VIDVANHAGWTEIRQPGTFDDGRLLAADGVRLMTFSRQILVGLALGAFTGLFFGERAAALSWAADGFVKLLQMMVLPYITVSIIASLGSIRLSELRTLGLRAAAVIGGLWLLALSFAFLIPLTFPPMQTASFFSSSLVERRPAFNFIDLYIPANPFNSLANNVVPAVVLFSLMLGVALVGVERRERLLDVLQAMRDAISAAARLVTRLTPYGLFAIAANAAGTLSVEQLSRLQIYLVAYVAVALMVSLWVLPGLVAALTPIRARDMLGESRDALITACIAGDLFIVLPGLMHASHTLLGRLDPGDEASGRLTEIIVPASFNFPHTGKLLSLSFVLFAGWFADALVPLSDYPQLALAGLVTFFGSLNAAVPFLLDQFRIPADTFQLFLATGVINSRVGSLVAAVHTLTVALLVACAVTGHLQWRRGRFLSYAGLTAVFAVAVLGGTRLLASTGLSQEYSKDRVLASMHLLQEPVSATVARTASAPPATTLPPLETIDARGVLRVGFIPDALPFAFFNEQGDLVGYDVELAHRLAREMDVSLAFVAMDRDRLAEQLAEGYCDLVMSGIAVTTDGARGMLFSDSYLDETVAFVVPDDQREQYESWDAIRDRGAVTIAVPDVPYYVAKLRDMLPRAVIRVHPDGIESLFDQTATHADAVALPAERGSAWTLMHPEYSVMVPGPDPIRVPLAYPIGKRDQQLASFVNTWIALKRKDGTLDAVYKHWILGQDAAPPQPRWSILRDVLHWVE
jgi:Na+/H+-dicarboxylate symporter/ABC-type amino acid transport substrate-binding protein